MLICCLLAGMTPAPAQAPFGGVWSGTFTRDGADLAVRLRIEGGAVLLSADALRIADFPLRNVAIDGDRIAFELAGDTTVTRFEGRLQDGRIVGTMRENGREGSFALARRSADAASPCVQRPAAFANGDAALGGTLIRPREGAGRVPAVILMHGSGPESRDSGRFLASALCRGGIAALIYDKRGVGGSTGDWREARLEDLADDAVAGIAWLAVQEDIDPRRIGLYGHSQGGSIAPLVANRSPHLAFVIAAAGAGVPMAEVERFSLTNAVRAQTQGDADAAEARAYIDRLIAVAGSGNGLADFLAGAERFRARPWFVTVAPPPIGHWYWRFSRASFRYDAAAEWRRVRQPALLLYGARDERTPVEASVAALRALGNRRLRIEILPGAGHAFDLPADGPWPRVAPGYPARIVAFARAEADLAADGSRLSGARPWRGVRLRPRR
ncbi:MAG TPA: alpha/beta fold hydrolase [Allosphingosinicella sp.]|nr:alpha/beta fold hydrolase [Allosphingosinicella sp.]